MSHAAPDPQSLPGARRRWLWRLVRRLGLSNAVPTFNPRDWSVGIQWRPKPRALWLKVPMLAIYWPLGLECPNCKGHGGWSIEAGGGCWYDECETCAGKGVVSPNMEISHDQNGDPK